MYIISQNKLLILNADKIKRFEVFGDSILAKMEDNDTGCILGKYNNNEQAQNEMKKILSNIALFELMNKINPFELIKDAPKSINEDVLDGFYNMFCYKMS